MTERVDDGALEQPADRTRPGDGMGVFSHRTVVDGSGGKRLLVHRDRVVDEQLDPDSGEASRRRTASAVRGDSWARKNGAPSISSPATMCPPPSRCHNTVAPNAAL